MTDLAAEWATARSAFTWADYSALLRGIDQRSLARSFAEIGLGAGEIAVQNGKWRKMFRGERAIIVPAQDPGGYPVDLIAFRMDTPMSFWPLSGAAAVLGEDEIDRASAMAEPLQVHECPLDWLKAGRRGCVILDYARHWPLHLGRIPALQFEDAAFARRAAARMQNPISIPPVLVRAA